jgi:hypothetical protein
MTKFENKIIKILDEACIKKRGDDPDMIIAKYLKDCWSTFHFYRKKIIEKKLDENAALIGNINTTDNSIPHQGI